MSRDPNQTDCYVAEEHVWNGTLLGETQDFGSLVAQTRELEATPEWRSVFGTTPIDIGRNDTGNLSWARGREISYLTATARYVVPHEMAHLITDDRHGHNWRSRYVWLVAIAYGDQYACALAAGFRGSRLSLDILPVNRATPVWPPELFAATVGGPLIARNNPSPRGAIAL